MASGNTTDKVYTPQLHEAGGSGNCYFYSLYEALKQNNLLPNLNTIIPGADKMSKVEFNLAFRKYLSESNEYYLSIAALYNIICGIKTQSINDAARNILEAPLFVDTNKGNYWVEKTDQSGKKYKSVTDNGRTYLNNVSSDAAIKTYISNPANKTQLDKENQVGFNEAINTQMAGFFVSNQQLIRQYSMLFNCLDDPKNDSEFNKFFKKLQESIVTNGVWVDELSVRPATAILKRCNIQFQSTNSLQILVTDLGQGNYSYTSPGMIQPILLDSKNTILLCNRGEGHWQWFDYKTRSNGRIIVDGSNNSYPLSDSSSFSSFSSLSSSSYRPTSVFSSSSSSSSSSNPYMSFIPSLSQGQGPDFNPLRSIHDPKFSIEGLKDALERDRCNQEAFNRYLKTQTDEIPPDVLFGPIDPNVNNNRSISYESIIGLLPSNYLGSLTNLIENGVTMLDKTGTLNFLSDMRFAGLYDDCNVTVYSDAVLEDVIETETETETETENDEATTQQNVGILQGFIQEQQEQQEQEQQEQEQQEQQQETIGNTLFNYVTHFVELVVNHSSNLLNDAIKTTMSGGKNYNQSGGDPTPEESKQFLDYAASIDPNIDSIKIMEDMLSKNKDLIDVKDVNGYTPLMHAVGNQNINTIKFLLNNGAGRFIADNEGSTALDYAKINENQEIINLLTISEFVRNDGSPEKIKMMQDMVKNGQIANVNVKDATWFDNTALHMQSLNGTLDAMKWLVDNGADINIKNGDGLTPLMFAVMSNDIDKVQFLLQHGADKTDKDINGDTVLSHAKEVENIKPDIMKLLESKDQDNNGNPVTSNQDKKEQEYSVNYYRLYWLIKMFRKTDEYFYTLHEEEQDALDLYVFLFDLMLNSFPALINVMNLAGDAFEYMINNDVEMKKLYGGLSNCLNNSAKLISIISDLDLIPNNQTESITQDTVLEDVSNFFLEYSPAFFEELAEYTDPNKEWVFSDGYTSVGQEYIINLATKTAPNVGKTVPNVGKTAPNPNVRKAVPFVVTNKSMLQGPNLNRRIETSVANRNEKRKSAVTSRQWGVDPTVARDISKFSVNPISVNSGGSLMIGGGDCEGTAAENAEFEMIKYFCEFDHDFDGIRAAILNKDVFQIIRTMLNVIRQGEFSQTKTKDFYKAVIDALKSKEHIAEAEFLSTICDNLYEQCSYFQEKANYFPTIGASFKIDKDSLLKNDPNFLTKVGMSFEDYSRQQSKQFLIETEERYPGSPVLLKIPYLNVVKSDTYDNIHGCVLKPDSYEMFPPAEMNPGVDIMTAPLDELFDKSKYLTLQPVYACIDMSPDIFAKLTMLYPVIYTIWRELGMKLVYFFSDVPEEKTKFDRYCQILSEVYAKATTSFSELKTQSGMIDPINTGGADFTTSKNGTIVLTQFSDPVWNELTNEYRILSGSGNGSGLSPEDLKVMLQTILNMCHLFVMNTMLSFWMENSDMNSITECELIPDENGKKIIGIQYTNNTNSSSSSFQINVGDTTVLQISSMLNAVQQLFIGENTYETLRDVVNSGKNPFINLPLSNNDRVSYLRILKAALFVIEQPNFKYKTNDKTEIVYTLCAILKSWGDEGQIFTAHLLQYLISKAKDANKNAKTISMDTSGSTSTSTTNMTGGSLLDTNMEPLFNSLSPEENIFLAVLNNLIFYSDDKNAVASALMSSYANVQSTLQMPHSVMKHSEDLIKWYNNTFKGTVKGGNLMFYEPKYFNQEINYMKQFDDNERQISVLYENITQLLGYGNSGVEVTTTEATTTEATTTEATTTEATTTETMDVATVTQYTIQQLSETEKGNDEQIKVGIKKQNDVLRKLKSILKNLQILFPTVNPKLYTQRCIDANISIVMSNIGSQLVKEQVIRDVARVPKNLNTLMSLINSTCYNPSVVKQLQLGFVKACDTVKTEIDTSFKSITDPSVTGQGVTGVKDNYDATIDTIDKNVASQREKITIQYKQYISILDTEREKFLNNIATYCIEKAQQEANRRKSSRGDPKSKEETQRLLAEQQISEADKNTMTKLDSELKALKNQDKSIGKNASSSSSDIQQNIDKLITENNELIAAIKEYNDCKQLETKKPRNKDDEENLKNCQSKYKTPIVKQILTQELYKGRNPRNIQQQLDKLTEAAKDIKTLSQKGFSDKYGKANSPLKFNTDLFKDVQDFKKINEKIEKIKTDIAEKENNLSGIKSKIAMLLEQIMCQMTPTTSQNFLDVLNITREIQSSVPSMIKGGSLRKKTRRFHKNANQSMTRKYRL
jgi:ankyrin repeat protein